MNIEDKKIMELRLAMGITEADLAAAMNLSVDKVINVENGKGHYSGGQRKRAKEYLGIAGAPLTKDACTIAKEQIYLFRNFARERRFDEAEAMYKELRVLAKLEPCDFELSMLFLLFEAQLKLLTNKLDAAEEKLTYLHSHLEEMCPKHQFYFYSNMGTLHVKRGRYNDGVDCCEKALELSNSNNDFYPDVSEKPWIVSDIGICYSNLQYPVRAMISLLDARRLRPVKEFDRFRLDLDLPLAKNYIKLNHLSTAKDALDSCLLQANVFKDTHSIGLTKLHYGELHMKSRKWKKALGCLDESIACYKEGTEFHFTATYRKTICLINARALKKAKKLIVQMRMIYSTHEVYSVYVESATRYLTISGRKTLSNPEAVKYIKTVTIPHLLEIGDFFEAMDYYKLLEEHYAKSGNQMKSLLMSKPLLELFERCFLNQD